MDQQASDEWAAMSGEERLELWRENQEAGHWSSGWPRGMFYLSPTAIAAALARRKKKEEQ